MAFSLTSLSAEPAFDLELFMTVSQETRINADLMDRVSNLWDRWLPHAKAVKLDVDGRAYLLVWLDPEVEDSVDDAWEDTPSEAFFINALAQVMVMGLVHSLVPEVEDMGCAPAPKPTAGLAEALTEAGVPYAEPNEPPLARLYAVLTHYPFKGGCEVCTLVENCPKAAGAGPHSVVLPGWE